jgi:hypothetical protein
LDARRIFTRSALQPTATAADKEAMSVKRAALVTFAAFAAALAALFR